MRLDDVALAHVAHPEHETQLAVPLTDDRVSAEQQGLCALLGSGELGEHHTHHERLYHHTRDTLQTHDEYRGGALILRVP